MEMESSQREHYSVHDDVPGVLTEAYVIEASSTGQKDLECQRSMYGWLVQGANTARDSSEIPAPSRAPSGYETDEGAKVETIISRCPSSQCKEAEEEEVMDCIICLEGMDDMSKVSTLPCKHSFHEPCIMRWMEARGELRLSRRCPHCNQEVDEPASKPDISNIEAELLSAIEMESVFSICSGHYWRAFYIVFFVFFVLIIINVIFLFLS
ncbi:hypothetical protein GUITHDRAFT_110614 [Guillardia theta CCMP2712]|uniref:RING-type E3 ubiquitin transferase n=1 Tax=Guillardia theta (strain CCMP2712) TaxID=905079 RepID=L1J5U4_GUITC|nr:hypothetical protein GUITHDRAFT_110614 [Guillardia theta CCMP2712]EKX43489.1 hypothetical protein GUITHDRAFT_110614 [Guillardia theta CCMP2712]|eukprot:XP_005830469.1 hypothetical protein GUITHDRAFT_110614 [Guillardia theta CCMP2712]